MMIRTGVVSRQLNPCLALHLQHTTAGDLLLLLLQKRLRPWDELTAAFQQNHLTEALADLFARGHRLAITIHGVGLAN